MKDILLIFAADHRSTLKSNILNIKKEPNKKQIEAIREFKSMILEALKLSINKGLNKNYVCLLMDEDYGSKQLKEAKKLGIKIIVPVERSGQKIFEFNYGKNFKEHIEKFNPDYVKVLLNFNPENKEKNKISLKNLRILNNYIKTTNYKFLIEVLISPTEKQIKEYSKTSFDIKARPASTIEALKQLHIAGIFPDIWKLEGFERKQDLDLVANESNNSKIIILGRSESMARVLKWIKIATKNDKVIGFAVGRTIFIRALQEYYNGKISREKAIKIMGSKYSKVANFYLTNSKRYGSS